MKNNITFLTLVLVFLTNVVVAQENIQSTVTVTKDFESKLSDIHKTKYNITYPDSLMKFNLNFDYSGFDRPYKDLYEFSPLNGIQLQNKGVVTYPNFYFKGGLSFPITPLGELYFQPNLGKRNSLVAYVNHNSYWGDKTTNDLPGVGSKGFFSPVNRSDTKGGLRYSHFWSNGEVSVDGFYSNKMVYFNKVDEIRNNQIIQNGGGNFRVRSLSGEENSLYYDLNLKYIFTDNNTKGNYSEGFSNNKEHLFGGEAKIGFAIKGIHLFEIGIMSENSILMRYNHYGVRHQYLSGRKNRGMSTILPKYRLKLRSLSIDLGVGLAGVYGDDGFNQSGNITMLYPYINLSYELIKEYLWITAKVDGDNHIGSYYELTSLNPWITNAPVINYSTPFRSNISLAGSFNDLIDYSIGGGFTHYDNYLTFVGQGDMVHTKALILEDLSEWNINGDFQIKSNSVDFILNGKYRYFGGEIVPMTPQVEATGGIKYNYMGRIFAQVCAKYCSGVYGKGVYYDQFVDLSASVSYLFNPAFSLYIKGENLLNSKIYYVQNYIEPGVNFGAGICLKF